MTVSLQLSGMTKACILHWWALMICWATLSVGIAGCALAEEGIDSCPRRLESMPLIEDVHGCLDENTFILWYWEHPDSADKLTAGAGYARAQMSKHIALQTKEDYLSFWPQGKKDKVTKNESLLLRKQSEFRTFEEDRRKYSPASFRVFATSPQRIATINKLMAAMKASKQLSFRFYNPARFGKGERLEASNCAGTVDYILQHLAPDKKEMGVAEEISTTTKLCVLGAFTLAGTFATPFGVLAAGMVSTGIGFFLGAGAGLISMTVAGEGLYRAVNFYNARDVFLLEAPSLHEAKAYLKMLYNSIDHDLTWWQRYLNEKKVGILPVREVFIKSLPDGLYIREHLKEKTKNGEPTEHSYTFNLEKKPQKFLLMRNDTSGYHILAYNRRCLSTTPMLLSIGHGGSFDCPIYSKGYNESIAQEFELEKDPTTKGYHIRSKDSGFYMTVYWSFLSGDYLGFKALDGNAKQSWELEEAL